MRHALALCIFYYVGYFLSPFDFLNECLTFFLFKAAFKRLPFFRLFMLASVHPSPHPSPLRGEGEGEGVI